MAAIHGTLNAFGFALAAIVAWTLDRRATAPIRVEIRRPRRSASHRWAIGLVTGLTVGIGVLTTGTLGALLGILALLLLSIEPERDAPIGGLFLGGGIGWLVLLGTAPARCGEGCVFPDLAPWIVASIAMIGVGLVLTWLAVRRQRAPTCRLRTRPAGPTDRAARSFGCADLRCTRDPDPARDPHRCADRARLRPRARHRPPCAIDGGDRRSARSPGGPAAPIEPGETVDLACPSLRPMVDADEPDHGRGSPGPVRRRPGRRPVPPLRARPFVQRHAGRHAA